MSRSDVYGNFVFTGRETNAVVSKTLPKPDADYCWVIDQVLYGFSAAPAAPTELTITLGGTVIRLPAVAAGVVQWTPSMILAGDNEEAVEIELGASGGAGTHGYLTVLSRLDRRAT